MRMESFSFALIVAAFGSLVVFGLLALLSGFMVAIRNADNVLPSAPPTGRPARQEPARKEKELGGAGVPRWAVAAAVAYLMLEEEEGRTQASPWTDDRSGTGDPWLANRLGELP